MTWHTSLGEVIFEEQIYRHYADNKIYRVINNFGVYQHGYSHKLQYKVSHAGQAETFDKSVETLRIMSDLEIGKTAVRRITLQHGAMSGCYQEKYKLTNETAEYLMSQTDGSCIPISTHKDEDEIEQPSNDGRKNKKRIYKEMRLNFAENNRGEYFYEADFIYTTDIKPFIEKAIAKVGFKKGVTKLYAVSDGAKWIYNTYKSIDSSMSYTVDYYHLQERLAPLAQYFIKKTSWHDVNQHYQIMWLKEMSVIIKAGNVKEVVNKVKNNPSCYGGYDFTEYVENRPECFNYHILKELGLPIGSGRVEGGHKSIIQKRVIKSGVGWTMQNVKDVINLRLLCANGLWENYWEYYRAKCAISA